MQFHYLLRGVVVSQGRYLAVREKGKNFFFIPGGHIEPGESATDALRREFKEELDCEIAIGDFLGALEHQWPDEVPSHQEINLLFAVKALGLEPEAVVVSNEAQLEFKWLPIDALQATSLEPPPLKALIGRVGGSSLPLWAFWGSTIGKS